MGLLSDNTRGPTLLAGILSSIDSVKRNVASNARGLLSDPAGTANMLGSRLAESLGGTKYEQEQWWNKQTKKPFDPSAVASYETSRNNTAMNAALALQTVYHGSPHRFDKFDMSKIGTGEGAQIYGHGIYTAESKAVADQYAGKLAKNIGVEFKNKAPQSEYEKQLYDSLVSTAKTTQTGNRQAAVDEAYRRALEPSQHLLGAPGTPAWAMPSEYAMNQTRQLKSAAESLGAPSLFDDAYLYKIDIPDEAVKKMLDWDKGGDKVWSDAVNRFGSPEKARAGLLAEGFPGIKYLDGDSRVKNAGSSNYVIFDDSIPRIIESNGVGTGLSPWAPGEWKGR